MTKDFVTYQAGALAGNTAQSHAPACCNNCRFNICLPLPTYMSLV